MCMLLLLATVCAVGFEGCSWSGLSGALGNWSPGGVLHQG